MPLTCGCGWDDDWEWLYDAPNDYSVMSSERFPKSQCCESCKRHIGSGELCTIFPRRRRPEDNFGESLLEGEYIIPMPPHVLCEECSDLWFSLEELGFCVMPYENMRDLVAEYAETFGK